MVNKDGKCLAKRNDAHHGPSLRRVLGLRPLVSVAELQHGTLFILVLHPCCCTELIASSMLFRCSTHVLLRVEAREHRLEPRRELLDINGAVTVLIESTHELEHLEGR